MLLLYFSISNKPCPQQRGQSGAPSHAIPPSGIEHYLPPAPTHLGWDGRRRGRNHVLLHHAFLPPMRVAASRFVGDQRSQKTLCSNDRLPTTQHHTSRSLTGGRCVSSFV